MDHRDDTSASGIIQSGFEGVSATFTDVEILRTSEYNVLARAKRYGKWWMLKGLNPEAADSMAHTQMLRKEFDTLMSMSNQGVVQAVSVEEVEGIGTCIVMEYVEGVTLDVWAESHTSRAERLQIAGQLLNAVEYVHSCGIAHRDLKPSNIMVATNGGTLKIIDFGLADSDRNAILKQPAGTRRYMSPEQAAVAGADVRNDIYSIGVIMNGLNLGWCFKRIIGKCLRPIEERYQSIAELKKAMACFDKAKAVLRKAIYVKIIIAVSAATWFGTDSIVKSASQEKIDSLQMVVATTRANIDLVKAHATAQIDSMRGVLKSTSASVKKMEDRDNEVNAKANRFNQLKDSGFAALERCWQHDLKGLPEADDPVMYILEMLNNLQEALKRFVNSHRAGLTKSEAELLTEVLNNRIVFYYNAKSCEMMEALQQQ